MSLKTFKYFCKKNSQYFSHVFCVIFNWPRLLPGLCPFIKKNFFRLRRDIPIFVIILFDPHQKIHHVFHWPFTCYSQKTLKYFFKKNLSIFFTCFLCNFYMTSKHWPRLLPGLCPFIKKIFPPSGGTSLFFQKNIRAAWIAPHHIYFHPNLSPILYSTKQQLFWYSRQLNNFSFTKTLNNWFN